MPFTDPVVAGSTLVRDAIQSEDYQPGVSGWIIRRDGSAEFNTGTYRGSVVINDAGGLPAVTIDANGMRVVDNPSGSAVQLDPKELEGAVIRLTPKNTAGFTWLSGKLYSSNTIYPGPISNPRGFTALVSAVESGRRTSGLVLYGEGTQPNEPCTALISADLIELGGSGRDLDKGSPSRAGNVTVAGKITATGETWKPFPYLNGWGNYTDPTITDLQYRRTALGETQIRGFCWSPGVWNVIVGKMPVAYGSSGQQMIYANTFGPAQSGFRVDPDGTVRAFGDTRVNQGWWVNGTVSNDMG